MGSSPSGLVGVTALEADWVLQRVPEEGVGLGCLDLACRWAGVGVRRGLYRDAFAVSFPLEPAKGPVVRGTVGVF